MKRLLNAGIAAVLVLLAGCASVPQKKTPDDCLVVIKVRTTNPDNLRWGRDYRLELTPEYPAVAVPNGGWDIVFVVREPAVKVSAVTSTVPQNGFYGSPTRWPANLLLPYDPGHIAVADFVVVRKLEKNEANKYMEHFDFAPATDDDKAAALATLKADPRFASWDTE
jgi:hypothetical protein